jgi:hypothetical protein
MNVTSMGGSFQNAFAELNTQRDPREKNAVFSVPASPELQASSQGEGSGKQISFDANTVAIGKLATNGILLFTIDHNPLAAAMSGMAAQLSAVPLKPIDGSVSKSDFESMIGQLGGTTADADRLFSTFDANGDGSISHKEFLAGIARIGADGGDSPFTQTLGRIMDGHGNHNGTVDTLELGDFDAAFLREEKGPQADAAVPAQPEI